MCVILSTSYAKYQGSGLKYILTKSLHTIHEDLSNYFCAIFIAPLPVFKICSHTFSRCVGMRKEKKRN
jgi:hypothetical protein